MERRLVADSSEKPPVGKLRYRRLLCAGNRIRIRADDVYAILPLPMGVTIDNGSSDHQTVITSES